jgi:hypothetical protein
MRQPKRLQFYLRPRPAHYAPAPWLPMLPWVRVSQAMAESHAALLRLRRSFGRLREAAQPVRRMPPGSKVYVFKPGGEKTFIGVTV